MEGKTISEEEKEEMKKQGKSELEMKEKKIEE